MKFKHILICTVVDNDFAFYILHFNYLFIFLNTVKYYFQFSIFSLYLSARQHQAQPSPNVTAYGQYTIITSKFISQSTLYI